MENCLKPKTLTTPQMLVIGACGSPKQSHQDEGKQGALNGPTLCDHVRICNTDTESTWGEVPAGLYHLLVIKLNITSARYGGTSGFGSDLGPFSLKNTL